MRLNIFFLTHERRNNAGLKIGLKSFKSLWYVKALGLRARKL